MMNRKLNMALANHRFNLLNTLLNGSLVLVTITGIVLLQNQEIKQAELQLQQTPYLAQEKQENQALNFFEYLPSLGMQNLVGDWLYLKFIQYFGDSVAREKTGYELCPTYFKNVVARDPHFVNAIINLDVCTSIFAGRPLQSIEYLKSSVHQMQPKMEGINVRPYYIWRSLGIAQLLFLGKPLEAANSYHNAINWAKSYQDKDSQRFISNLQKSIDYLAKNPNSKMAQIGAWVNVLNTNPDEKTFKRVVQEIETLGGKVETSPSGRIQVSVPENAD